LRIPLGLLQHDSYAKTRHRGIACAARSAQMKPILPSDKLSAAMQASRADPLVRAGPPGPALRPAKSAQATDRAGPGDTGRQFGGSRIEASEGADVVFVTCEFEKLKLDARIPVNKESLVSGLNFGVHYE
jgi:hypothetical protein